ncbi:hypothetical protein FC093_07500 [Ilyomonas limi]|uniref:Uncharacterized protein n=1 Tax=Ilyomonas limi TaxID=2575867 RepID=A0A4V5UUP5_9BACT|nr:hypothetical protein [Ilyomonas limi]TKK69913.1 hypothetical protein FC093_07500 [Ilyomonas limi]
MDTQQNKNEQDISLQAPGEANREKHINFLEKEEMGLDRTDADNAGDATFTPVYLDADNTLQTPEEKQHDEQVNPGKNTKVEASEDDLDETLFDRLNKGDKNTGVQA